jgi:hypothetical protein
MAINSLTQQSAWNPFNLQAVNQPVAVGPIPTPYPPQGVVYTPQYPAGQVFGVQNPPAYTSTPEGQQAVRTMETSSGTSSVTKDNLMSMYPGYAGWNPDAAWQDYLATGGAGKSGDGNSGGGPGGAYPPTPPRNPLLDKDYSTTNLGGSLTDTGGQNPSSGIFDEIFEAAKAGNQSAIDMINSQYGQNESELNRQLGMTDTYEGNDLATLLAQFNKTGTEVDTQKTTAKETVDQETAKAADQARSTQRQNRNVLRALGILGSTYAAENLAAPMNQFDKQKAELVNWGTKRMGELETYANEKRDEYDRLTNEVKTKYGELREKIMADLRYNNQQKADALKAATAGAQQNLAQLNMQKAQYEQQIQQYSQSLTTQIAQMLMNKAPNANLDQIAKQSIAFSNNLMGTSPNKQVAVVPGQSKAGGFDMSNYIGWDPNSAYQDYLSKNKSLT